MTRRGTGTIRIARQLVDVRCEECGVIFTANRRSARFCSMRCMQRASARRRYGERICVVCSATFVPCKATSRSCSGPCRNALTSRATAERRADALRGRGTGPYVKRGLRHEHRTVAEEAMGRPLEDGEVVHHVNGDSRDNSPENLQVMSRREHGLIHAATPGWGKKR